MTINENLKRSCCPRQCLDSLNCKHTFFCYSDWRVFAYSPVSYTEFSIIIGPFLVIVVVVICLFFTVAALKRRYQVLYLAYRWIVACYFLAWLVLSIHNANSSDHLIYMTNWAFITFNLYLLVAAISVSTTFITVQYKHGSDKEKVPPIRATPSQVCMCSENKISWYQMVQWL